MMPPTERRGTTIEEIIAAKKWYSDLEKEFKQVEESMENASKDYEMMMKIHQELKENFQKLVQNKT